jgi:aspartate carbamoyltransferase catalytic subunit
MHPGPANVGVEITAEVAYGPRAVITRQVQNGVFVRMAALRWALGRSTLAPRTATTATRAVVSHQPTAVVG